ncbi:MAG: hypothetical protein IKX35_03905 [Bacteroidales bacterium]|nr:hypothetical protein [Bacteroidales bacterium]MBR5081572.1 hypothetical protein [Bacteroidales bacterium]
MEEYKDEYTSFDRESKTQEIIGTVVIVCFCVAICGYFVYDLITSAPVYSSVMGFVFVAAVTLYFLLCRPLKNIDVLERRICKRLDTQGYPHEKREGTLYITKNDNHFRIYFRDSFDRRIKHLYFLYDFYDDNFGKVSMEGWTRAANCINTDNTLTTFVVLDDHFCCSYQTAIANAKDFMKEFDCAYRVIGEAMNDYNRIYPRIEQDYPNTTSENKGSIGFR